MAGCYIKRAGRLHHGQERPVVPHIVHQCAHSTLYNVQQNVHHAHLQNWSIHTGPSFARAVQVDHDHGGPIGPWWSQAPAAQDVKVDSDVFGYKCIKLY